MNLLYTLNKFTQELLPKLGTPVPPEYEAQFDQHLLKNSLFRLKIFIGFSFALNLAVFIFRLFSQSVINGLFITRQPMILYFTSCALLIISFLFFPLTGYFSKKKNRFMLWCLCYVLALAYVFDALLRMFLGSTEFENLYSFSQAFFLMMFIPDFKRRVYVLPAILFYLATVSIIAFRHSPAGFNELQPAVFLTFLAIIIVKMSNHNDRIKVFVDTQKISELNQSLIRANEQLEALAVTDELTKLHNRRSFLNYFEIIWKQGTRMQFPVNVLMVDVDYFKKYNDSLGHLEGDRALISIAQCLKKQTKRETDFVARFGGEEFVCLLPYIEKTDADIFAQKLVQSVEAMKIPHPQSEHSPYVTISVGMAAILPSEHCTKEQLLNEADEALYKAKQSGRNRVITN